MNKSYRHPIAAVINFCTNDLRFLEEALNASRSLCRQLIVSVCDHLFNGTPENYSLLEWIYQTYPECTFIEFAFDAEEPYGATSLSPADPDWVHHWHNSGRLAAFYFLEPSIDYLFFWDVDEIPDPAAFQRWLDTEDYKNYAALRFSSYWYFREARFRATSYPDTGIMVRKAALEPVFILHPDERMGLFYAMPGPKQRWVKGIDGEPMLHHYSWVRTKPEMLKKTNCWGHHWEREWTKLIEEEYRREFNGKDFVRYYEYEEVVNPFDPLAHSMPELSRPISLDEHIKNLSRFPHVKRVDAKDVFRMDVEYTIHGLN